MRVNDRAIEKLLKIEPIVLALFCVSFFLRLAHLPFSAQAFIVMNTILAMIYIFKSSLKNPRHDGIAQFVRKGILTAIAIGLIALLYEVQLWPFGKEMSLVFLSATAVLSGIVIVKNVVVKEILSMTEGLTLLGLIILLISSYFKLF